jgi:hypothetical protein
METGQPSSDTQWRYVPVPKIPTPIFPVSLFFTFLSSLKTRSLHYLPHTQRNRLRQHGTASCLVKASRRHQPGRYSYCRSRYLTFSVTALRRNCETPLSRNWTRSRRVTQTQRGLPGLRRLRPSCRSKCHSAIISCGTAYADDLATVFLAFP